MRRRLFTACFFLVCIPFAASAHQPKCVSVSDAEAGIAVAAPEISKAYYCELKGKPHVYRFSSEKPFAAYAGILVPGKTLGTPVSFELQHDGKTIFRGDGASFTWKQFYEEHGGDWYMSGPEYGAEFKSTHTLPAGEYTITVFNETNTGKYSLAIGDVESFPFFEIVKAIWNVMLLKLFFF